MAAPGFAPNALSSSEGAVSGETPARGGRDRQGGGSCGLRRRLTRLLGAAWEPPGRRCALDGPLRGLVPPAWGRISSPFCSEGTGSQRERRTPCPRSLSAEGAELGGQPHSTPGWGEHSGLLLQLPPTPPGTVHLAGGVTQLVLPDLRGAWGSPPCIASTRERYCCGTQPSGDLGLYGGDGDRAKFEFEPSSPQPQVAFM